MLTNRNLFELTTLRRDLHRWPEVSGEEDKTAAAIVNSLSFMKPTQVITGLGGHGVAVIFDGGVDGPTALFRAELDALPV